MTGPLTLICQIISVVSLVANIYLFYIYYMCPVKVIKSYKYFFLLTAIQDILFSTCVLLTVPVMISNDFAIVFLATGPVHKQLIGQVMLILFILAFVSSLLIVTNSFIYRYIQVCRSRFFDTYQSGHCIIAVLLVNASIVVNWLTIAYVNLLSNLSSVKQLSEIVKTQTNLDLAESAQLSLSLKFDLHNPIKFGLIVEILLLMIAMCGIMVYSALQISKTLKRATFSENLKRMHRQMFTLLLLQTACPLAFLHTPCFLMYLFFFTGLQSTLGVTYVISILMSFFPLLCPIIIIGFLSDYRNHTLTKLGLCRITSQMMSKSVFVSEMRSTLATRQNSI